MNERRKHYYETTVVWEAERHGLVTSTGLPYLRVSAPPEFKGHEGMWSPEHYFVASVTSCFMTTFLAVAEASKLAFVSSQCRGAGKLEQMDSRGFFFTEVVLEPHLKLSTEADRDRAIRILEKAEKHCFISASIRATVRLEPTVSVAVPAAA